MDSVDSRTSNLFRRMLATTLRVLGGQYDLPRLEERRYEQPAESSGKVNDRGYVAGPRSERYQYKRGE